MWWHVGGVVDGGSDGGGEGGGGPKDPIFKGCHTVTFLLLYRMVFRYCIVFVPGFYIGF